MGYSEGRIVNPGHIFEGMWFCIDYARGMDDDVISSALSIIQDTAEKQQLTGHMGV